MKYLKYLLLLTLLSFSLAGCTGFHWYSHHHTNHHDPFYSNGNGVSEIEY